MNLGSIVKKAALEARDFFFPNLCLSCHEIMKGSEKLFCQKCVQHLFLSLSTFNLKGCAPFTEILATFDHPYLSSIFLSQAKQQTKLYQVLASFMVIQLQKMECSTFDIVMPAVSSRRFSSHKSIYFLARYVAEMLGVPSKDIRDKDPLNDKVVLIVDEKLDIDRLKQIENDLADKNFRKLFAVTLTR